MNPKMKVFCKTLGFSLCLVFIVGICTCVIGARKGLSMREMVDLVAGVVSAKTTRHTVAERVAVIVAKKPYLKQTAASAGGSLKILVFKQERMLEVHASGWSTPLRYPMTGFSGKLGPKLLEGDGQIPEGIYGIEYLNPNSRYYLSMKLSYPNETDRQRAKTENRTNLGGDIMIHGNSVTVGCIPIGDDAVEDVFCLVDAVGIKNVSVIIAPYDMRKGRRPELESSQLTWYGVLCDEIERKLK